MALLLMFDGQVYSKYFTKPGSKVFSSKTVNIMFAGKPDDYIFFAISNFIFQKSSPRGRRCSANLGVLQIYLCVFTIFYMCDFN